MKKTYGLFILVALIIFSMLLSGCARDLDELREENENLNKVIKSMGEEIDSMKDKATDLMSEAEENWGLLQECIKEKQEAEEEVMIIVSSTEALDLNSWTLLDSSEYDFTDDGTQEAVLLYTSALKDDAGNIMWDDGQFFMVLVKAGEKTYRLFNERVQIGRVYYSVFDADDAGVFVTVSTYAGISIVKYAFSSDDDYFIGKTVFDTYDTNIIHSTMPWD